jgi:hypothetical protein
LVEALTERGQLSGAEVDIVIATEVAARSIRAERQRREDWQQRERSAAQFLQQWSQCHE